MGEARRRKLAGLPPPPAPARVREIRLELPVELVETLRELCPPKFEFREWLVGALAAFADHVERQKEVEQQKNRLIVPAVTMPRLPPGPPSPPRYMGPKQWA